MKTELWFPEFCREHRLRNPHAELPEYDSEQGAEFYAGWKKQMVLSGLIDPEVAREASIQVALEGPHPRVHFKVFLRIGVKILRERRDGEGRPIDPSSREAAERASKDCSDCHGQGLTVRFRHRSAEPGRPTHIVCYCLCGMGRWVERRHREDAPEVRKRIWDLADYLWLQLRWIDGELSNPHCRPLAEPACDPSVSRNDLIESKLFD